MMRVTAALRPTRAPTSAQLASERGVKHMDQEKTDRGKQTKKKRNPAVRQILVPKDASISFLCDCQMPSSTLCSRPPLDFPNSWKKTRTCSNAETPNAPKSPEYTRG